MKAGEKTLVSAQSDLETPVVIGPPSPSHATCNYLILLPPSHHLHRHLPPTRKKKRTFATDQLIGGTMHVSRVATTAASTPRKKVRLLPPNPPGALHP